MILLSYPGEAHGLRNLENQKDFLVRIQQFYDHYLKDKPAPDWMTKGVPFLKKGEIGRSPNSNRAEPISHSRSGSDCSWRVSMT